MNTSDSPDNFSTKQVLIVLCGLIGSGKSTLATALEREHPEFRRCNQDELGRRGDVEREARLALSRGLSVCIDRTNFDPSQRRTWIELAHQYPQVEIWGLQMDTPYDICRARLIERRDHPTIKTPEQALQVLSRFAADFVPMHPSEGFNRIFSLPPHHSPEYTRDDIDTILATFWDTPFLDTPLPPPPKPGHSSRGRGFNSDRARGFNSDRAHGSVYNGRGFNSDRARGTFPHRGRGQPRGSYAPRGQSSGQGSFASQGTWRSSPAPSPAGTAPARTTPTSTQTQGSAPAGASGAWRSFDNTNSSHTHTDTRQPYTPKSSSQSQAGPPASIRGEEQGQTHGNPRDEETPIRDDLPRADEGSFRSPGIGTGTGGSTMIVMGDAPSTASVGPETGTAESSH
ncbi:P-loop containing nucleoside triphosphate hydrolase protein [Ceratobasidium sp. AG-I]|nr:P-loop containing nucleoside triphosphate hydrolase protein [Ceratobasidium sp. AG-I]